MCGIAGFFGKTDPDISSRVVKAMLDSIAHRGPDGRGTAFFDTAALGHVRLAIIDLEGGIQPMTSRDKRFHVSFNGEIYNYKELRNKLIGKGCIFQTESDTEIIIHAYAVYGLESFDILRGMFAFALWDEKNEEGFLVRDRFGIKPLFYTETDDKIYFASEIKALLGTLSHKPSLNLQSLHLLMNFRYVPGVKTLFNKIFHLEPGNYIHWKNNSFKIKNWQKETYHYNNPADLLNETRNALQNALSRQLVSDVPLGAYLSAGLDSSTIVSLAIQKISAKKNFPTFTIQTGDSPKEARHAKETADFFGIKNIQESLSCDVKSILPRLIWHLETPKVNAYQSALVASLASRHVKVVLSGLGGDEIFLGYNMHRLMAFLSLINNSLGSKFPGMIGASASKIFAHMGMKFEELGRGGKMISALPDFATAYGILRNVWDDEKMRRKIYGPRMLDENLDDAFSILKSCWPAHEDPVRSMAAYEIRQKMVNDFLLQEDRLSMAFGLEVRVPFLDEDLVSLINHVDRRILMQNGKPKKFMQEVIGSWLPPQILNRPKSGFQVPIHQFFQSHLRPLCTRYLSRKRLEEDQLFNPEFVEKVLKEKPHFRLRWHYFILYLMIGTNIWIDIFERDQEIPSWN